MKVYYNCCSGQRLPRPGPVGQFPEAVGAGVAQDLADGGQVSMKQTIVAGVATGTAIYVITKLLDRVFGK